MHQYRTYRISEIYGIYPDPYTCTQFMYDTIMPSVGCPNRYGIWDVDIDAYIQVVEDDLGINMDTFEDVDFQYLLKEVEF